MFETAKLWALLAGSAFVLGMILSIELGVPHDLVLPVAVLSTVVACAVVLTPSRPRE